MVPIILCIFLHSIFIPWTKPARCHLLEILSLSWADNQQIILFLFLYGHHWQQILSSPQLSMASIDSITRSSWNSFLPDMLFMSLMPTLDCNSNHSLTKNIHHKEYNINFQIVKIVTFSEIFLFLWGIPVHQLNQTQNQTQNICCMDSLCMLKNQQTLSIAWIHSCSYLKIIHNHFIVFGRVHNLICKRTTLVFLILRTMLINIHNLKIPRAPVPSSWVSLGSLYGKPWANYPLQMRAT